VRRLVPALAVVGAIAVVVIVLLSLVGGDGDGASDEDPDADRVESDDVAVSVSEAVARQPLVPFVIRGYVYDDGAFVQLCNALTREDLRRCGGPSVLLEDLDLGRLALARDEADGRAVRYTEEPVLLGGTLDGTTFSVEDILAVPDDL
jgi:hypothetical protein